MSDGGESAAAATNDNDDDNTAEDQSSRDDVCGIFKTLSRDWKDGERPEGEEICPETHAEPPKSPTRSFPREWNSNLPLVTAEPEMLCSILTEEVSEKDTRKILSITQLRKVKDNPFSSLFLLLTTTILRMNLCYLLVMVYLMYIPLKKLLVSFGPKWLWMVMPNVLVKS